MKTYAETQNEPPFDWVAFLNQKTYTDEELEKADELACDWVTCACGNLCDAIPRIDNDEIEDAPGAPKDFQLERLGLRFMDEIEEMHRTHDPYYTDHDFEEHRAQAIDTLVKIEERSREILAEMGLLASTPKFSV